ncbi:MAG: PQQ-binding-like beta-propeller repeat protein [Planctomycetota bacterium]
MKRTKPSISFLAVCVCATFSLADDWPQWRGPDRDGQWREDGVIEQFPSDQVALKWRVPISSGYSGPTVAEGRVYVTDRVVTPEQMERVHCFAWESGAKLWSHEYACSYAGFGYTAGPRASVLVDEGRAYSLGAAGHLICFDAADGDIMWRRDLRAEYEIRMPNWGIAASPIIEEDLVIVQIGGEDACVVAFDKRTGRQRWQALPDDASYSAPIVVNQARHRVLICWTGERIVGLDPQSGREHWDYDFEWEKWPIGIATPVVHRDKLLISDAHKGSLLLQLSSNALAVKPLWHRRREEEPDGKALHCLTSTPKIQDQHIYGVDGQGVLRCLELETGEQIWEDRTAVPENRWATIHLIRNGPRTWMFTERGELIIARLTPEGFEEISRAKLIEPTTDQLRRRGGVTWSHPAFAYRHVFARNDKELVCADLRAE